LQTAKHFKEAEKRRPPDLKEGDWRDALKPKARKIRKGRRKNYTERAFEAVE
jgi:hypothetical protein